MGRGKRDIRFANGIASAVLAAFFLLHGILGGLSALTGLTSPLAWIVWLGVALVGVHVVASVSTSRGQLLDADRPPSPRKKRHLALKWATGALLALAAVAHVAMMRAWGAGMAQPAAAAAALSVALAAALAAHIWVGSRSLLKDLGVDRKHKAALRAAACAAAAFIALAAIAGAAT